MRLTCLYCNQFVYYKKPKILRKEDRRVILDILCKRCPDVTYHVKINQFPPPITAVGIQITKELSLYLYPHEEYASVWKETFEQLGNGYYEPTGVRSIFKLPLNKVIHLTIDKAKSKILNLIPLL